MARTGRPTPVAPQVRKASPFFVDIVVPKEVDLSTVVVLVFWRQDDHPNAAYTAFTLMIPPSILAADALPRNGDMLAVAVRLPTEVVLGRLRLLWCFCPIKWAKRLEQYAENPAKTIRRISRSVANNEYVNGSIDVDVI
ncbi:MAG: hypothetical protein KBD15_01465 [Candidatus Magasanikbacteria bacterium]|nr:hypothetical protein [Candidatus Magasanikbacteria bacterium]